MARLTDDSKKRIEKFVKENFIGRDIFIALWKAKSKEDIMESLKQELMINEITSPRVWTFIIHCVWSDMDCIFDRAEILLLKEILRNDGVVMRTSISSESLNQYMTTKAIQSLKERNVISVLTLSSNEKVIIIHPKLAKEVFKEKEEDATTIPKSGTISK